MITTQFLTKIFEHCNSGYINIWTLQDKKSHWFTVQEITKIEEFVSKNKDKDIYFGVGLRSQSHGSNARGKNEDVSVITGFWSDIDIKGQAHKQENLPETMEDVTAFLDSLELKPSIIVHSGNGVHAYWLFDKPIVISTDAHRDNVQSTLQGFQRYINEKAKERGWKLDNTSDLARVLRLVGSVNHKNDAVCVVYSCSDVRYPRNAFSKYIDTKIAKKPQENESSRQDFKNFCTGKGAKCIDNCLFMMHCRDNAEKLPEPEWHAMISNLSLASDGDEVCHELSSKYPGYNKAETENKVQRAKKECKPHTCKYIKESLGFDCGSCDAKVKAPIGLAVVTKLEKALATIKREYNSIEDIYTDETLEALAYLKKNSMKDYAVFKSNAKNKFKTLNLVEFEKAVGQQVTKQVTAQNINATSMALEGIELGEVVLPENYIVSMQGIKKVVQAGENLKIIPICNCPIVISERYVNLDNKNEKVALAFYIDYKWKSCIGNRADIFNKATLLKFSNKGLKVSTNNAAELIGYLDNYEGVNMDNIKIKQSIDRLGWVGEDTFFPYVMGDITFETDSVNYSMYESLASKGDRDRWLSLVQRARQNKYARFMLATSIASTLIEKMGVRNFMVHLWDDSKSGKTAILKLALSFWGDPAKLMGTFNATEVSLELRASTLNNLPLGIDEKQVGNERKIDFEKIVYMLSTGESKSRGQKDGGVQTKRYWRNIAMATGEEPLLKGASKDGSSNRCMQIKGRPVDNEAFGKEIHNKLTRHYGYGGKDIIEFVCKKQKQDNNYLETLYDEFSAKFNEQNLLDSYADYCSAICVGDYLLSTLLFNVKDDVAKAEAIEMALEIHSNVINGLGGNNTQRGMDFIQGWLVSNNNRFSPDSTPCYGKVEGSKYYCIPEILEKALDDEGFTPSIILAEMVRQGIVPKTNKSKPLKEQTWVNGHNTRCYCITIDSNEVQPLTTATPNNRDN